jgi:formylglycine-generating enzyme required for sulfatase activity
MRFVPLPKGTFYMGWNGEMGSAKRTEVKEAFEIAVHPVTQGQWQAVMSKNPSYFSSQGLGKKKVKGISAEELELFPVESLTWDDSQEFIKTLNKQQEGKGWVYRLPSEVEWEYACRGGATTEDECSYHFYFDKSTNKLSPEQANFNPGAPYHNGKRVTKVGSYAPNTIGLYDMHGNVWEWCSDLNGPEGRRVARGGSWNDGGIGCGASSRASLPQSTTKRLNTPASTLGLRLVRVADR